MFLTNPAAQAESSLAPTIAIEVGLSRALTRSVLTALAAIRGHLISREHAGHAGTAQRALRRGFGKFRLLCQRLYACGGAWVAAAA
jgi:hypothetical protein